MRKRREEDNFSMVKTIIIAVCSAVAYLAVVIGLTVYCSIRLVKAKNMRKQYIDTAPVIASKYLVYYSTWEGRVILNMCKNVRNPVADARFPRREGVANLQGGYVNLFGQNFPEICMKMKEFWSRGCASLVPFLRSANASNPSSTCITITTKPWTYMIGKREIIYTECFLWICQKIKKGKTFSKKKMQTI